MTGRILVAGIGNIFLGDDGFGVEVVRRLAGAELPADVEVVDIGIRGMHLAYQLLDGYDALVMIDATPRGGTPGQLYVLEPDLDTVPDDDGSLLNAHGMQPDAVLALLRTLSRDVADGTPTEVVGRVLVLGCEPQSVEEGMGLSAAVAAAVEPAVELLQRVLRTELRDAPAGRL